MEIKQAESDVFELLNKCAEAEDNGDTIYPGMTYEQGIRAGIEWLTGDREDKPIP